MQGKDAAFVIRIGERYFRGLGRRGRVLTACSLAGAKLFQSGPGVAVTADLLNAKGKDCQIWSVALGAEFKRLI